jgi:hypothetical protein
MPAVECGLFKGLPEAHPDPARQGLEGRRPGRLGPRPIWPELPLKKGGLVAQGEDLDGEWARFIMHGASTAAVKNSRE